MNNKQDKYQLIAKTFSGLENILAQELKTIGAENISIRNRAVSFEGDKTTMYRANFHVRTAISILKTIDTFFAKNEDELYKGINKIKWSKYMSVKDTFAISAVTFGDVFQHSRFVSLKTKDAIADQFRRRFNKRPDVNTKNPDLKINIHISDKKCTVLLDSSGDPLFKRGYKVRTTPAPINEVLAAGMIKLSGWQQDCNLYDPMCGSGTILIEAAMMAYGIAPGTFRKHFGFESWNDFDSELFSDITEETYNTVNFKHKIYGSDVSSQAIEICKENLTQAFLTKKVEVSRMDFFDSKPLSGNGIIITNPPYGERLKPADLKVLYQKIGDKLKQDYQGYSAWVIGSDVKAMKFIGLKPDKKIKLYNGPLECSYRKFSVYGGSKKNNKKNY